MPIKIYYIYLVVDSNQVLSLYGPYFKTLSDSSLILLTPHKSSTYEYGPHFNTLSGSSCLLMDPRKSSTYKSGLYLKTPPESSLETTTTLYHLSSYSTYIILFIIDLELLLDQLFYTIKTKSLAFI
ncbi:unnamed protein product [Absidia cylindrospora]